MNYDVYYQGSAPPASIKDLSLIEENVSGEVLVQRLAEGRAQHADFNIVVSRGGVRAFFNPPDALVLSRSRGRNLTWGEFLDVGARVDTMKFNAVLSAFPIAVELGRRFVATAGMEFADIDTQGTLLSNMLGAAVQAQLISVDDVAAVKAMWIERYPQMAAA